MTVVRVDAATAGTESEMKYHVQPVRRFQDSIGMDKVFRKLQTAKTYKESKIDEERVRSNKKRYLCLYHLAIDYISCRDYHSSKPRTKRAARIPVMLMSLSPISD